MSLSPIAASEWKPATDRDRAHRVVLHIWRQDRYGQPTMWVTHIQTDDDALCWGHYFQDLDAARKDFRARCRERGLLPAAKDL